MKRSLFFLLALLSLSLATRATQPSGTLPIMYIQTADGASITSCDTYLKATYWIVATGADSVYALASQTLPDTLQIKGRGNWTWNGFDKKPYRLKLANKTALLGLKKNKHFALMACADDNKAFLRNTVGFWLSEQIGIAWTPKQRPVEVVLNGDYIGLYFLTETIRIDKNRVNIVEQPDNITNADSITGGWLVEIDNYDTDPHITVSEGGSGYSIYFTYKTPEVLSSAQETFLSTEMNRLNTLIYGDKNSDELWNYLDIDALAKYYIVCEIMDDYESFHGSCYLYRDMGTGKKWMFGPVWDFGSAFNYTKSQYCYEGREWHQVWIAEICKFPAFQTRVKELWADFAANHYNDMFTYIDSFKNQIASAAQSDAERWPDYGNSDIDSRTQNVKTLLRGTKTWLASQWGDDDSNTWTVWFKDNGSPAWENIHCYIYDYSISGYDGNYQPLGNWPGTAMQTVEYNGETYYSITFTPAYTFSNDARIIFNNSGSGSGNQTENLVLVNKCIYNREGVADEVPTTAAPLVFDESAPVTYYTLQGMQIPEPLIGQPCLRHQSTRTQLILIPN